MTTTQSLNEISLWVAGKPRGKDRPRFSRKTGRTFTTKETVNAEAQIVQVWREAGEPRLPDGPVALDLLIQVERPRGHFNTKGDLNAEGLRYQYPFKAKPDVDNALKLVMDALNGRAYSDDVRVVGASVQRAWSGRAGIRVTLNQIGEQQ